MRPSVRSARFPDEKGTETTAGEQPYRNPSVTIVRRGGRGPIVPRRSATDANDCKRATALRKHERRLGSPVPGYTDRHEVHGRNDQWSIRADRALDDSTGVGFAIPHPPC